MIVAHDSNRVIGNGLDLPKWHLTDDFLLNFKLKTKGCPVIMGRKTAQSLRGRKPLPGRTNIVVTSNPGAANLSEGFVFAPNLEKALELAHLAEGQIIWIIGGGQIYKNALESISIDEIHITKVHGSFEGDVYFPEYDENRYELVSTNLYLKRDPVGDDKGNTHDFDVEVYKLAA